MHRSLVRLCLIMALVQCYFTVFAAPPPNANNQPLNVESVSEQAGKLARKELVPPLQQLAEAARADAIALTDNFYL
ncbi:uncharacterized protein BYT42DRAFT_571521 [Radiomyces spectabilis]|uniref:uncharacterized protein n=1 Tax=Radiomyces spectabilis TaxID=64574 RepID=UPI0022202094|nr:uncharacterized protein BYT42DRAFT_571521 [Radiomyces spectabilis]KAI8377758.1 hypothetical protein BYT42DRAFT_571521 [Radiomyces spectabilis]